MRKIKFSLSIGFPTARHEEIVEYDDSTTNDEIDDDFSAWVDAYLDAEWWEEK